jgi:hypothetical protein
MPGPERCACVPRRRQSAALARLLPVPGHPAAGWLRRGYPPIADLGYPHSSAVRDADRLSRELRPRGGRSAWRAFYRRFGDVFVVAAVGSEAEADPRDFKRAVAAAEARMEEVE